MFPESPDRSEQPGTILSQKAVRRLARRAEALRENLRRRRERHLKRVLLKKKSYT